ncbi:hypothetical protein DXG01_005152 [Tephrocybe rancida]|nr:hypothetical protein DXG01_005152 [Tephrocybe rancida]
MPSLRQSEFFYLLKFFQHRDPQGPREAHEFQYAASETRRDDAFRAARFEFRQEFVEAEKSWATGQQDREELFERMNTDLQGIFDNNQRRQEGLYQESDTLQESTFQRNETKRDVIFQEGQSNRATMYEKEHDFHVQRSTWFRDNRAPILIQGRQTREKACVDMEAAFSTQFTRLSRIQEDTFPLKEQERDAMVATLLAELRPNPKSSDKTVSEVPFPEPIVADSRPPVPPTYVPLPLPTPVTIPYPQENIWHLSRPHSPQSIDSGRGPVIVIPAPGLPSRETSTLPLPDPPAIIILASRLPSQETSTSPLPDPLPLTQLEESIDKEGSVQLADPFEERFLFGQRQRSEDYADEEERREGLFKAAEAERDLAEGERTQTFERKGQLWQKTFQDMLDAQQLHYDKKEQSRTEVHTWRDYSCRAVQQSQANAFAMLLMEIEKQAQGEDSLEEGLCAELNYRMELDCSRQIRLLEATRKDQWDHFTIAQLRRRGELGHLLPKSRPISLRSQASDVESLAYRPNVNGRPVLPPPPEHQGVPMSAVFPMSRSSSRSSSHRRSPSPATGLALGTLLVKGATTLKPLPLPEVEIELGRIRVEKSFQGRQKRRQILFERAQYRREQEFEKGMEKRRRVFVVNEQRRVDEFAKQQRVRKGDFVEREDQRESQFKEAQQRHEASFFTAEFHLMELAQNQEFCEAQRDRSTDFHAKQQEIQTNLFATERTRLKGINDWGMWLLQEMEQEGKAYELEEAEREDIFKALISLVHTQSC